MVCELRLQVLPAVTIWLVLIMHVKLFEAL
jgi:hypothetical protein